MDSDKVDDKQLDILDCNCVKTVKRLRASSRKISVLRTENFAVNTRTICLPSIYIYKAKKVIITNFYFCVKDRKFRCQYQNNLPLQKVFV